MSYKLWTSDRFFPVSPIFDFLSSYPSSVTLVITILLLLGLIISIFRLSSLSCTAVVSICLFLFALDQNRLQPWVYYYFLCFVAAIPFIRKKDEEAGAIGILQLIIIAVYFWGGMQKFSPGFIGDVFSGILTSVFHITDNAWVTRLSPAGYFIPVIEILTGIGLFFVRTRKVSVYVAIGMHLFIIVFLMFRITPNTIVIPWNVAMILMLIILFYRNTGSIRIFHLNKAAQNFSNAIVFLLVVIMPALNFFGCWDSFLSFSIYSGKANELFIAVSDDQLPKLNHRFDDYFLKMPAELQGGKMISVNKWALEELNVPVYPEQRIFRPIAKSFCNYNIPEEELIFVISDGPLINNKLRRFTCSDLK